MFIKAQGYKTKTEYWIPTQHVLLITQKNDHWEIQVDEVYRAKNMPTLFQVSDFTLIGGQQ